MKLFTLILFLSFSINIVAQKAILKGKILDKDTKKPLQYMTISFKNEGISTVTEKDGTYKIEAKSGNHIVVFNSLAYGIFTDTVSLKANETLVLDKLFTPEVIALATFVKTESRYEKPIEEITVSMSVVKPYLIENKNAVSAEQTLNQVPGINIIDNEPQIRGGSGYSFGAGSRVMVLLNDMPLLAGDAGRPNWGFIPLENISQIEIIKGASSVLYGSSALSGVINFRTAYPTDKPKTKFSIFSGIFDLPEEANWTNNNPPLNTGASFLHSRKIGRFDLVIGGNGYVKNGFRGPPPASIYDTTGNNGQLPDTTLSRIYDNRFRLNFNTRYRFKKTPGLTISLGGNFLYGNSTNPFIWLNDSSGIYQYSKGSVTRTIQTQFYIDPVIKYVGVKGSAHTLRSRIYYLNNNNSNNQSNSSQVVFAEYQYRKQFRGEKYSGKKFLKNFTVITGATLQKVYAQAELFLLQANNDEQLNLATYLQLENKFWKRLTLVVGARVEYFKIANIEAFQPVFRGGLNIKLAKATYLRASFGQGYRFPTIAERYIQTTIGAAQIFPNPNLKPERSISGEIGIKQGFEFGRSFKGYFDVAGYYQHYYNYIEFTAGVFGGKNLFTDFGFISLNTGQARVYGVDVSLIAAGEFAPGYGMRILTGYNFTQPETVTPRLVYATDSLGNEVSYYSTSSIIQSGKDTTSRILKYRFRHTFKFDVEFNIKMFNIGASVRYNSFMENIDYAFVYLANLGVIPNVSNFRKSHQSGNYVLDLRLAYEINEHNKISFLVRNLLNRTYSLRPLLVEPPRYFALRYELNL